MFKKNVLITGHTGFKGSWLTAWLKLLGAKVMGISLNPHTHPSHFLVSKIDKNFMPQIRANILEGKIDVAKSICQSKDKPVARLLEKGISRIGRPLEDINSALENAGRIEIYKLERNVSILATISGVGPMIGFLGTVIGMILSIFEISNAGGNIDMQLLSNGLYTAMTTTVAGLIVGIIGYITYNHLVVKTNKIIYQMEATSLEFFDLLNEPT